MELSLEETLASLKTTERDDRIPLLMHLCVLKGYEPLEECQSLLAEAVELGEIYENHAYCANALVALANVHYLRNDIEMALEKVRKAVRVSEGGPDIYAIANAHQACGTLLFVNKQYEESQDSLFQAMQVLKNQGLDEWLGPIYNTIALNKRELHLYEEAIDWFLKGIEIAESKGNMESAAIAYHNMADCTKDPAKIKAFLDKSFAYSSKAEDQRMLSATFDKYITYFHSVGDLESMIQMSKQALEEAEKGQSPRRLAACHLSCCRALLIYMDTQYPSIDADMLKQAGQHYQKLDDFGDLGEEAHVSRAKPLIQARLALFQSDYTSAIDYGNAYLNREVKEEEVALDMHRILSNSYEALGDLQAALDYNKQYTQLFIELEKKRSSKEIEELYEQYQTRERQDQIKRLQELEELKTRFFSQITHELRTPLTLILGPAQLIQNTKDSKQQISQANIIERNAQRLLDLVNQLLDVSKIEAGMMSVQKSRVSLSRFIDNVIKSFQGLARQRQIQLDLILETEELILLLDTDKLNKILYNLLSNAFKFTEEQGRVICQVSTKHKETESQATLEIQVSDNGRGISPEAISHVFDRYYQEDKGTFTTETKGTGIGLNLSKELCELMQGELSVESALGKGSSFRLVLPVDLAQDEQLDTISEVQAIPVNSLIDEEQPGPLTTDQSSMEQRKDIPVILFIEDTKDLHRYVKSIFKDQYILLQAFDGIRGLEIARERLPDLIISDVMMPGKDGFEVCAAIKEDELTNHIPVILLTGKTALQSRITGFEKGADAYLAKPFSAQELELQSKNLLATSKALRAYLSAGDEAGLGKEHLNKTLVKIQSSYLDKMRSFIESHLEDDNFSIAMITRAFNMSRSQLYRKIHSLTGLSIVEFIRKIRIKKAIELLQTREYSVSEVAYKVGCSASYFSRLFVKHVGQSPSSFLSNNS